MFNIFKRKTAKSSKRVMLTAQSYNNIRKERPSLAKLLDDNGLGYVIDDVQSMAMSLVRQAE